MGDGLHRRRRSQQTPDGSDETDGTQAGTANLTIRVTQSFRRVRPSFNMSGTEVRELSMQLLQTRAQLRGPHWPRALEARFCTRLSLRWKMGRMRRSPLRFLKAASISVSIR